MSIKSREVGKHAALCGGGGSRLSIEVKGVSTTIPQSHGSLGALFASNSRVLKKL